MIGDCNIRNLAKNQVYAVFHSRAIRKKVSPKLLELNFAIIIKMKIFTLEL